MNTPFYSRGLRFECTGCSRCCRHEPGYVFLSDNDLSRLCAAKELSRAEFLEKYCRSVNIHGFSRLSLREKITMTASSGKTGAAVFMSHVLFSAEPIRSGNPF